MLRRLFACAVLAACAGRAEAPRPPSPPPPAPPPPEQGGDTEEPPGAPAGACAPDLASCMPDGCAAPGSPHAALNRAKRANEHVRFEDAVPITVAHMIRLQAEADRVLVKGRDIEDRRKIARFDLGDCAIGEGTAVRVAGYVAPSGRSKVAGAHEGGPESVNCRLATSLDFHIPITAAAKGEDECHGVVVEMIPQGRAEHPGWTIAALHDLARSRRLVLFVGRLFYDNEHLVRPDCAAPHVEQPKRASLWEVHPVVDMYVCKDDACSAESARGWVKID